MVGFMSYGNKKFESLDPLMRELIPPLRQTMLELIDMVDKDTNAFKDFMVSCLKRKTLVLCVRADSV
jgi:glutamate formiminotransferase/formiminotetrahydrofolate cyclodeaminase